MPPESQGAAGRVAPPSKPEQAPRSSKDALRCSPAFGYPTWAPVSPEPDLPSPRTLPALLVSRPCPSRPSALSSALLPTSRSPLWSRAHPVLIPNVPGQPQPTTPLQQKDSAWGVRLGPFPHRHTSHQLSPEAPGGGHGGTP